MNSVKNMSVTAVIALLDKTRVEAEAWNAGAYKTSNEQLFQQLGTCLDALNQLMASDVKSRRDFTKRYNAHGFKKTAATTLATMVVRYVFRLAANSKRSASYARVLRAANERGIDGMNLSAWILENGGIEQIRRTTPDGKKPSQIEAELVELAQTKLAERKPLLTPPAVADELKPRKDALHGFSIAILLTSGGKSSIVCGLNDERLVKFALARAGKRLNEEIAAAEVPSKTAARKKAITSATDAVLQS